MAAVEAGGDGWKPSTSAGQLKMGKVDGEVAGFVRVCSKKRLRLQDAERVQRDREPDLTLPVALKDLLGRAKAIRRIGPITPDPRGHSHAASLMTGNGESVGRPEKCTLAALWTLAEGGEGMSRG